MLEWQRRDLLENMGLKILQPRFLLPAAKPSSILRAENFRQAEGESQANVSVLPVEVPSALAVNQAMEPAIADPVVSRASALFEEKSFTSKNAAVVAESSKAAIKAIKYRHRLVRVGELLLLLDQPSLEWHDADRCKVFFADIYFALTGKKFEYWSDAQFDWPPVKNFPLANDESVAQQSLHAFLHEQVQQPPCKCILACGQGVSHALLGKTLAAGEMDFINNLPVLILENYQDYWVLTHKKQILWQQLQVVKKSLASNA